MFKRLSQGQSLRSIAQDFEERGIRGRPCPEDCARKHEHHAGKVLTPQHLRDIALRPLYGGLRVHRPANRNGRYHGSLDDAVKAKWDGLVDEETFHAVRRLLQAPERRTSRPGRAKHLLSLIAACDVCGGLLTVSYRRFRRPRAVSASGSTSAGNGHA